MATTVITIHVHSPPASAITFTPLQTEWAAPVLMGTHLGRLTVDPPGWAGDIEVTGAALTVLELDTHCDLVAAEDLPVGDYTVTATATP